MGTDDAFFGVCAKFEELHDFSSLGEFSADLFDSLAHDKTAAVVDLVDLFDVLDGLGGKSGTGETNDVDGLDAAVTAFSDHEGRHVKRKGGTA